MPTRFRLRDAVAAVMICGLAAAVVVPAVARSRESARRGQCLEHLRAIGVALRQYHDARGSLPPAAIWEPSSTGGLMLLNVKAIDRITRENWAQLLLPYLGRADVAALFDRRQPVMALENTKARTTRVEEFTCPADDFNSPGNQYGFQPIDDEPPLAEFARGNYAVNGGTHSIKHWGQSTLQPRGESMKITIDKERRLFRALGTGVAGINQSLAFAELVNGQSTLVAVDEIRAGVHPLDMRGVWALGHIGASITWSHGVVGDDGGPNNQSERADDILHCRRLHEAIGSDRLAELGMPCVRYVDRSQEATARSQHPGGVHVLFVDGAARFVGNGVDRGLWHVMHSRETPAGVLEDLDAKLASGMEGDARFNAPSPRPSPEGRGSAGATPPGGTNRPHREGEIAEDPTAGATITNSIGMTFVALPAGTFTMGIPDVGNDGPVPAECPPHEVALSRAFWMGAHEVTQRQYESVVGTNPSQRRPADARAESMGDFPVENVTWHDAEDFCVRLSDMPDEKAAKRRYRLPTEAEWEYACRSGKSEPYRWRERRESDDQSGDAAGIEPPLPVAKVGSYAPNEFGLYDMRGNVWEWCADWFDRSYYSRSPRIDPQGPAQGYLKVVRGSDWIFVGEPCHINYPIMSPWRKSPFVGFRVVCEVTE